MEEKWEEGAKPEYYSYNEEGKNLYSIEQAKSLAFRIMAPHIAEELPIAEAAEKVRYNYLAFLLFMEITASILCVIF